MRNTRSRYLRCNPAEHGDKCFVSFLLLRELIKPLKKLTGLKDFSRVKFFGEAIDRFSQLPRRERDRRRRAMSKKWPKLSPDYRSPDDRVDAIVGNAMLLHWMESQKDGAETEGR